MNRSLVRPVAFVLLAILLCGCSDGPVTPPWVDPADGATLMVSRRNPSADSFFVWDVVLNGTRVGQVGGGEIRQYLFVPRTGFNTLRLRTGWYGSNSDELRFAARQGEVIALTTWLHGNDRILAKRVLPEDIIKKIPPPWYTAEQKSQRMESASKEAAVKGSRRLPATGGPSGVIAHLLWPVYRHIPALGGWDWLVLIVLLCLFGRVLTLPFRWKIAKDGMWTWWLLAFNSLTQWLCVWFFQTQAAAALLGDRVWLDAVPLTLTGRGLYWTTLVFSFVAGLASLILAAMDEENNHEPRVATAHMEAGILLLFLLLYWYWSVTSLVVFLACLASTQLTDLARAVAVGWLRWKRRREAT